MGMKVLEEVKLFIGYDGCQFFLVFECQNVIGYCFVVFCCVLCVNKGGGIFGQVVVNDDFQIVYIVFFCVCLVVILVRKFLINCLGVMKVYVFFFVL